ncbi:MAG: hypothetical protein RMA76_38235 [Deltaproteobacteria bacterium]|jgi:hypothetical protein
MTAPNKEDVREREVIKNLPVDLTDKEIQQKTDELLELMSRCDATIAKRSEAVSTYNGLVKEIREQIAAAHRVLIARREEREVICVERMSFDRNVVEVIRTDTKEVISSRAMRAAERQLEIDNAASPPPKKKGAAPPKKETPKKDAGPPEPGEVKKPASPNAGGKSNPKNVKANVPPPSPLEVVR